MRRVAAVLFACLLSLVATTAAAREVRVGVYDNPPKLFNNEAGKPDGLLVDLLHSLARDAGWQLIFQPCEWQACLDLLRHGHIDLLPDVAYSDERAEQFDFHPTPALISWSQIYRREDTRVLNYLDLRDKRIAVLDGAIQAEELERILGNFNLPHQMLKTRTVEEAFAMVARKEADVAVASHFYGDHNARRHELIETPIIFSPARLHYVTARGQNPELLLHIEARLRDWQSNNESEYFRILNQWRWPGQAPVIPVYAWWVLGGLLLGGVMLLTNNRWLRTRVNVEVRKAQHSEARFRHVFDSISDAIFVHDRASGRLLQVNRRMCEMYGCSAEEALKYGDIGHFSSGVPPHTQEQAMQWMQRTIQEGPQVFEWHARRIDNGQFFWVEISLQAIRLGDDDCLLAVVRDISERKASELALADYRNNLERMVEERTRELETARAQAEQLARVKSEFLANMSHEIRTPLNGVLGFAHLGSEGTSNPERARQLFERIVESGKLLQRVIDDILDYSKLDAGKLTLEQLPFSPSGLLETTLEMMRQAAESKALQLSFTAESELPDCLGDPLRIQQILLNLLSNAIKFTSQGSVRLSARYHDETLSLSVEDSGIGMSREVIGRLFQPFEQADQSTTRRFGGTGLGLVISARLVQLMNGRIEVSSEPGHGSRFIVHLPCQAIAGAPSPTLTPPSPDNTATSALSILIVEDDGSNQVLLNELLSSQGWQVSIAENGQQALDIVRQQGPAAFDLVLMDVMMPVMDGYEATRRLLAMDPTLPVVGQTAMALENEQQACLAAGMRERISKPILPATLFAAVQKYARRRPAV